jgi:hypothetical protein
VRACVAVNERPLAKPGGRHLALTAAAAGSGGGGGAQPALEPERPNARGTALSLRLLLGAVAEVTVPIDCVKVMGLSGSGRAGLIVDSSTVTRAAGVRHRHDPLGVTWAALWSLAPVISAPSCGA